MAGANAGLSRRAFAAFCSATLGTAAMAASPQAARVEAFVALSARLTGFPASILDRRFAATLLHGLAATGHQSALEAVLADDQCADCSATEIEIVSAWYSGLVPQESGAIVGTLNDALIWRAAAFATPPSICAPGWERPPDALAR